MTDIEPESLNEDALIALGWMPSHGHGYRCVVCRRDVDFGWESPAYKFYHSDCLLNSGRYKELIRKSKRAAQH